MMEILFFMLGCMMYHWKVADELYDLRYQNTLMKELQGEKT